MAPTTKKLGIPGLSCILCGETNGIDLHLADASFHCRECDKDFSTGDVQQMLARWQPVLAWVETMPS